MIKLQSMTAERTKNPLEAVVRLILIGGTMNTKRVVGAAKKWAEFMELRLDKFKWSQPERILYEAITSRTRKKRSDASP